MTKKANEPESLYVNATEVAKLLGIKLHILYYWEKKIPQIRSKRVGHRRFYHRDQVELLFKIKELLEEGYSLSGIAKILKAKTTPSENRDLKAVLKEVLQELKDIYQSL